MKESGEGAYRLVIVERLSLIAVLLFGLISFTTSRMMPAQLTSARNANEEILAVAGAELGDMVAQNNVEVPIAGGDIDESKGEKAEGVEVEKAEVEKVEAERIGAEKLAAEEAERAEAERMAAIEAAAEATRAANAAAVQRQTVAREAAAQKVAEQRAQQEAAAQAAEAARAKAAQVDYGKVVYTDDNGVNIDSSKTYPVIHYEAYEESGAEDLAE